MRDEALFINGVFDAVLRDIEAVQQAVPEQVLYLQPYSEDPIVRLYKWAPSLESPVVAYFSTTDDFSTVSYEAEIVGVRDKTELPDTSREVISKVIGQLQPTEPGVYMRANDKDCRNLLGVTRMRKLLMPFPVTALILLDTSDHPSGPRTTPGGWWYVHRVNPRTDG
jgi:hypothetical protein